MVDKLTTTEKLGIGASVLSSGVLGAGIILGNPLVAETGGLLAAETILLPTFIRATDKAFRQELTQAVVELLQPFNPIPKIKVAIRIRKQKLNVAAPSEVKVQNSRTLEYPIDVDHYRSYWGDWDIARELVSNALDAEKGNWGKVEIKTSGTSLTVSNLTGTLDRRDFYLGYSSQGKDIDSPFLGRFNEGMKFAIMAASRQGYGVSIRSGSLIATPRVAQAEEGIRVLRIEMKDAAQPIGGTVIVVDNVDGKKMAKALAKKILRSNDSRVRYSVGEGAHTPQLSSMFPYALQIIETPGVYIGGMFVAKSNREEFSWGYNFNPSLVRLSEGRNIFDSGTVKEAIKLHMYMIDDKGYWEKIFKDADKLTAETRINPPFFRAEERTIDTIREAWYSVFGKDAVVEDSFSAEAKYRGAKPIDSNPLFESLVHAKILPGGADFINRYTKTDKRDYADEELSRFERAALTVLRKIAIEHTPLSYKIIAYDPLPGMAENELGLTDTKAKIIRIKRSQLLDVHSVIDTLIEEMTHARFSTNDTSREHADGLREMSTMMLLDQQTVGYTRALDRIAQAAWEDGLKHAKVNSGADRHASALRTEESDFSKTNLSFIFGEN